MQKQQTCDLAPRLKTHPDILPATYNPDLLDPQIQGVAASNVGHCSRVAPAFEQQVSDAGFVSHPLQLSIHTAAADQAGLGTAIEHLFDGVKRGVIDAFA